MILYKASIIKRCIRRIQTEYNSKKATFNTDYNLQDVVILNIERLCQAAIDLGLYIVRKKKLGLPQSNREIFQILEKEGIIEPSLSEKLQKMVGFRNIAVHDYQNLNLEIVKSVVENHLLDFETFSKIIVQSKL